MLNYLLIIAGAVGGYFLKLYSFLFYTARIEQADAHLFYQNLHKRNPFKFVLSESLHSDKNKPPEIETSLIWHTLPFLLDVTEVHLKAGQIPKEHVLSVTTLRFLRSRLQRLFNDLLQEKIEDEVKIFLTIYNWFQHTNTLMPSKQKDIVLDETTDLFEAVDQFNKGERNKLGILLYGNPGNGKTSLIRHLACLYKYDIYIPIINSEMHNSEIVTLFMALPRDRRIIVVLEDFDSIFTLKEPNHKHCRFSFDVFLNILDGLYVNTDKMLFVMTANDISKIDKSIKNRPSRFDIVMNIQNPTYENRLKLLDSSQNGYSERIAKMTEGQSAAVVCELAKRRFTDENLETEVTKIMESFQ